MSEEEYTTKEKLWWVRNQYNLGKIKYQTAIVLTKLYTEKIKDEQRK